MRKKRPREKPERVLGHLLAFLDGVRTLPLEMRRRVAAVLAQEAAELRGEPADERRLQAYIAGCPQLSTTHDPNVAVESSRA